MNLSLRAIPMPLRWENPPLDWKVEEDHLSITAGKLTDLFRDPQGAPPVNNSPRLLFRPPGDFLLSAKVEVDFASTFDAGVLLIYGSDLSWAKLCFELSPQEQPTIVSVVTRQYSDDCNSFPTGGNQTYLRVARLERAFAFHASKDGRFWQLIRYFTLPASTLEVGFSAQSPRGESCTAIFSEIAYETRRLEDIRSGE